MPKLLEPPHPAKVADDRFSELQTLATSDHRATFFARNRDLATRSVVEALAARATSLLRIDPRDAENLIETSIWLADDIDDDFARGKAHRARANLAHIRGSEAEALTFYDSARTLFSRVGAELEAAITASSSIQTLAFLGLHDRALADNDFARQIFQQHGDRLRLARLHSNFATLLYHRDRWADAAAHYQAAYNEFLEVGEKQDVAVCLSNMAVCHLQQQDFVQALDFYRQTRAYCDQNGLSALTAGLDYNIAYLHYLRGQYTTALQLYRQTRTHHSELGDQHHVDLCALNEAEIYLELNLTGECVDLASLAYTGFSDRGLVMESAKALTILAIANSRQGKAFLALELLAQAQELFRRDNSEKWVAVTDLYRATIYSQAGRPFESRRLASNADALFQRFSMTAKSVACRVLLGRLALEQRAYFEARALCTESLEALREIDAPALVFQACFLLGEIESALGNRASAIEAYKHAHEQLPRTTNGIQTEEQRIQALDDKLVVYETLVHALSQGGRDTEKEDAFGFMEKAKSRSLADLLAFRAYALPETQPGRSKLADQVRQLREELNWYYRQIDLQEMRAEERSTKDVAALRRYSRQQETRLIRTLNQLQQTDKEFSSVQEAFSVDLSAIRSTLPPQASLIEYYIAKGTVLTVVIDQNRLEIVPTTLPSRVDELRLSLASALSRQPASFETTRPSVRTEINAHLEALYQELIEPVRGLLSGQRLVVVPHGSLFYLPFHAFRVDGRFLSEQFAISYAPSATAYHLARLRPRNSGARVPSVMIASSEDDEAAVALTRALLDAIEESTLSKAPDQHDSGDRFSGARHVHVVTKAHLRQDNPMFSTILFGSDRLHLFDLFQLRLNLELLTVSGWAPGLQGNAKGNEVVGLVRGLLYAGSRSVLTTLWDVDASTWVRFSQPFYRALLSGQSKQDALEVATDLLRRETDDPRRWAAFLLFGDTD
jgi:CHAT domain-containing protein